MAWAVRWRRCVSVPPHHWLSPKPQSPSSPSPPPPFAPPRLWQQQRVWGIWVEQREEDGDVIEGWNHTIPQGAPTSPSPSSLLFSPGDPLERQGFWHIFKYDLCECKKNLHWGQCLGVSPRPCFITDKKPASDSHIQAWHVLSPNH